MYHVIVRQSARSSAAHAAKGSRRLSTDAMFSRLVETSDAMRHACGFDSELFAAMQGLAAR